MFGANFTLSSSIHNLPTVWARELLSKGCPKAVFTTMNTHAVEKVLKQSLHVLSIVKGGLTWKRKSFFWLKITLCYE